MIELTTTISTRASISNIKGYKNVHLPVLGIIELRNLYSNRKPSKKRREVVKFFRFNFICFEPNGLFRFKIGKFEFPAGDDF